MADSVADVLAVAGAAGETKLVLIIGLGLAIILMAVASHFIAQLLARHAWIAWIGLVMILWVALDIIFRGSGEVICETWRVGCGMKSTARFCSFWGSTDGGPNRAGPSGLHLEFRPSSFRHRD